MFWGNLGGTCRNWWWKIRGVSVLTYQTICWPFRWHKDSLAKFFNKLIFSDSWIVERSGLKTIPELVKFAQFTKERATEIIEKEYDIGTQMTGLIRYFKEEGREEYGNVRHLLDFFGGTPSEKDMESYFKDTENKEIRKYLVDKFYKKCKKNKNGWVKKLFRDADFETREEFGKRFQLHTFLKTKRETSLFNRWVRWSPAKLFKSAWKKWINEHSKRNFPFITSGKKSSPRMSKSNSTAAALAPILKEIDDNARIASGAAVQDHEDELTVPKAGAADDCNWTFDDVWNKTMGQHSELERNGDSDDEKLDDNSAIAVELDPFNPESMTERDGGSGSSDINWPYMDNLVAEVRDFESDDNLIDDSSIETLDLPESVSTVL